MQNKLKVTKRFFPSIETQLENCLFEIIFILKSLSGCDHSQRCGNSLMKADNHHVFIYNACSVQTEIERHLLSLMMAK